MSSKRFPGKVLAPFSGRPIVSCVVHSVLKVVALEQIFVLTSTQPSDDPLVAYLNSIGVQIYRGSLENVFDRFRQCLMAFPCPWFVRICADSPLLAPDLLQQLIEHAIATDADLVTNTFPRTFPKGYSVEVVRSQPFLAINPEQLNAAEREHVTRFYYQNPEQFKIVNLSSKNPELAQTSLAVDTLEDLRRLEQESSSSLHAKLYQSKALQPE